MPGRAARCTSSSALIPVLLLPCLLFAQVTFQRTYGGAYSDDGLAVAQTGDRGYIVAGYTWSLGAGAFDAWLLKTDSTGDTLWTRTHGGPHDDLGLSVALTADGGYVIAGSTQPPGTESTDVWLLKTDSLGDTIWTRTFGGTNWDASRSVAQTSDGGYIVAGYTSSFGAGRSDLWLIRTDSSGDTIWTRTLGGRDRDEGYSVTLAADGGYVITGYTESFGAGRTDVWLLKTNARGNTVWTRTFGGTDEEYGVSVARTMDSGYVIAGLTESFGAGDVDVWLVKTDSLGDTLWTRTFGGAEADCGYAVAQTADGGYIVAGEVNGYTDSIGDGPADLWLVKTDSQGDTLWTRTFGGTDWDAGNSVARATDGGFVIAGYTESFGAGRSDLWLIKTDPLGQVGIEERPEPRLQTTPLPTLIRAGPIRIPGQDIEVFDPAGRRVENANTLKPGIYFLRIAGSGQRRAVTKVIVPD